MNKDKFNSMSHEYKKYIEEYIEKMKLILIRRKIHNQYKEMIDNEISFTKKLTEFVNNIDENDQYILLGPFILFLKNNIEFIDYLLENEDYSKEEIKLLINKISKNIKKIRKIVHKIKKTNNDDDDEFFWYAVLLS